MQPEPTKATFDPIPVLPPGIAPPSAAASKPAPKASEPAATKPSSPAKPAAPAPSAAPAVPAWLKGVFAPTKNKGIVAAAATSLLAGWYGVRTVFPPSPKPTDVAQAEPDTPPLPVIPAPEVPPVATPVAAAPTGFLPPIAVPAVDLTPVPSATTPVAVPPVVLDPVATGPKPVPFTVPAAATEIKPVSFDDIKVPALPTATGATPPAGSPMPPVIVPALPGVTPPAVPEKAKEKTPEVPPPAIPAVDFSGLGTPAAPVAPAPVTVPPATPPASVPPAPVLTVPSVTAPAATAPGGAGLVAPDMTFTKPAAPVTPAPVAAPPAASVIPVSPPAQPVYTPPVVTSPTPTLLPVSGGSPAPAAPAVETKTDFDVDLHYPKTGETYATISKLHYGDERYARVLEQFNAAAGTTGRVVQVPPTWWVKKQTGAPVSRPTSGTTAPSQGDEWSPAPANSIREYVVPATKADGTRLDGMTFRDIATQLYGSDQEWQRVFDLNPRYAADAMIPAGTKVRVTANK